MHAARAARARARVWHFTLPSGTLPPLVLGGDDDDDDDGLLLSLGGIIENENSDFVIA